MSNKELAKRMTAAIAGVSLDDIESAEAVREQYKATLTGNALSKNTKDSDVRV